MRTLMYVCSELISSPEPLAPSSQRDLVALAYEPGRLSKSERDTLLRLLLSRPDLTADLDAKIGEDRSVRVRAAWVARPGRAVADVLRALDGEDRQTVLAEIGTTDGLPAEVYTAVAERSSGVKALCAFISGPAATPAKCVAALKLISLDGPQIPSKVYRTVMDFIRSEKALRVAVLDRGGCPPMVRTLWGEATGDDLDGLDPAHLIDVLVTRPIAELDESASKPPGYGRVTTQRNKWMTLVDDIEALEVDFCVPETFINRACELGAWILEEHTNSTMVHVRNQATAVSARIDRFLTRSNGVAGHIAALSAEALSGSDDAPAAVTELATLAERAESTRLATKALSALGSSELAPEVFSEVLGTDAGWRAAVRLADLSDPETLDLFSNTSPRTPSAVSDLVRYCSEPAAALAAWSRSDHGSPMLLWMLFRDRREVVITEPQALPASILCEPTRSSEWRSAIAAVAGRYVVERFGATPAALEMVSELAAGTGKTVGDVCDVVVAALGLELAAT